MLVPFETSTIFSDLALIKPFIGTGKKFQAYRKGNQRTHKKKNISANLINSAQNHDKQVTFCGYNLPVNL